MLNDNINKKVWFAETVNKLQLPLLQLKNVSTITHCHLAHKKLVAYAYRTFHYRNGKYKKIKNVNMYLHFPHYFTNVTVNMQTNRHKSPLVCYQFYKKLSYHLETGRQQRISF